MVRVGPLRGGHREPCSSRAYRSTQSLHRLDTGRLTAPLLVSSFSPLPSRTHALGIPRISPHPEDADSSLWLQPGRCAMRLGLTRTRPCSPVSVGRGPTRLCVHWPTIRSHFGHRSDVTPIESVCGGDMFPRPRGGARQPRRAPGQSESRSTLTPKRGVGDYGQLRGARA